MFARKLFAFCNLFMVTIFFVSCHLCTVYMHPVGNEHTGKKLFLFYWILYFMHTDIRPDIPRSKSKHKIIASPLWSVSESSSVRMKKVNATEQRDQN